MRLSLLTGAVITLILLHAPIASADDDVLPANVRKHFDYFVGQWEMTGTVEAGDAVSTATVRWVPGKHMIRFDSKWSDPKSQSLGSGVFGWNAIERKVQLTEFWDDGSYHHRLFTIQSDTLWEGEEVSGGNDEGKTVRGNIRIEILGPDEWTYESSNLTVGGQPEQDDKLRFRRKRGNGNVHSSTREAFNDYCDAMVGRWVGEVTWVADWPGAGK